MRFFKNGWMCVHVVVLKLCNVQFSQSLSFTSAAAPRFDVFLSSITSDQWLNNAKEGDSSKIMDHVVEEVMRSCGGAVQGIREFDVYSNRADDSFIFYDCGSYSTGSGLYSFSIKDGGERFIISVKSDLNDDQLIRDKSNGFEVKVLQRKDSIYNEDIEWSGENVSSHLTIINTMNSLKILRCKMSSLSQNWMLQRVKWETSIESNNLCLNEDDIFWLTDSSTDSIGWFARSTKVMSEEHEDLGAKTYFAAGVFVPSSDEFQCVIRGLDEKGNLTFVDFRSKLPS